MSLEKKDRRNGCVGVFTAALDQSVSTVVLRPDVSTQLTTPNWREERSRKRKNSSSDVVLKRRLLDSADARPQRKKGNSQLVAIPVQDPKQVNSKASPSKERSPSKEDDQNFQSKTAEHSEDLDFFTDVGALPKVYWSDYISELERENRDRVATTQAGDYDFLSAPIAQYIFTICVRLRLPHNVRYTAAIIYSQFMRRQMLSLYHFLNTQAFNEQKRNAQWETIETNSTRQIPLRVLSAIQISSKFHSYHDSLSSRQVANCLRTLGFPYTIGAVLNSEMRFLRIIGYKINDNPLTYCEFILKMIVNATSGRKWLMGDGEISIVWQHVLLILDLVFMEQDQIYTSLLAVIQPNTQENKKEEMLVKLKSDFMLMAGSVICVAIRCIGSEKESEMVLKTITHLNIAHHNVKEMSVALWNIAVQNIESMMKPRNAPK